jgi:predicted DNA binding CopG/RHH family protein
LPRRLLKQATGVFLSPALYIIVIYNARGVALYFRVIYNYFMGTKNQKTRKADVTKAKSLLVRLSEAEKRAFKESADIAGITVSAWIRERLRRVARRELEEANRPIPF